MSAPGFRRRKIVSRILCALTGLCAAVSVSVVLFLLAYIACRGISSLHWSFFTRLPKPEGEAGGGIANAIVGSAKLVFLAALMGVPVGVLGAVYLSEYGGRRAGFWIRYASDILNGVPSIVIGIFAYALIVLPMKRFSALAGAAALGMILIPAVLRSSDEFLRLVPVSLREAALALGVPPWKMILGVVLPTALPGILTGILLGISRVVGETAPLIFTAFGNQFWDNGWLSPIASLPQTIFTYAISPYEDWHRQAWAAALVLMLVALAGNVAARLLMRSRRA